jgi:hypothetical protein
MAHAISWAGLETIEGIINGMIAPECMPFASLDANTQASIIEEIDDACADIAGDVTEQYPDLDDPGQRNARLLMYRDELLRRKDASQRDAYSQYFDAVMGVCLRNANAPRSYTIDSSGCAALVAA